MSSLEEQVVDLLDEGWARWKIAQTLGLGESTVRQVIRRLCVEHQCSQRDLPGIYHKENKRDRNQDDEEEQAGDPEAGSQDPLQEGELDVPAASPEEGER